MTYCILPAHVGLISRVAKIVVIPIRNAMNWNRIASFFVWLYVSCVMSCRLQSELTQRAGCDVDR